MIHVSIPPEFEPFVTGIVASGSYHDPAEVVGEALRLLARRDQLVHDVKAGVAQLDRGEYTEYDEASRDKFLADVKAEEDLWHRGLSGQAGATSERELRRES